MPRVRRATSFDEVPTLYERFRPGYPDVAIAWMLETAGVPSRGRVLEIGAGTGQLTRSLARRGLRIEALEPGRRLAAELTRRMAPFTDVDVVAARVEDAGFDAHAFDLVVAATSFHWVDPVTRWSLAARALRPTGALGVLRHDHVLGQGNRRYYEGAEPIFRRLEPQVGPPYQPPEEADVPSFRDEMAASGVFDVIAERRFAWDQPFTTATLIGLIRTHSDHRALTPPARAALVRELRALVDDRLGGGFVDRYVTTVCVGRPIA